MKKQMNAVVKKVAYFSLFLAFLLTGTLQAQDVEKKAMSKYPFAIESLNAGIASDNLGLRKSSIYMAGFYQINGSVDALISQLDNETDNSTKVLIALALYQIGNEKGIRKVEEMAKNEKDNHVRHMYTAVLNEFAEEMNANLANN